MDLCGHCQGAEDQGRDCGMWVAQRRGSLPEGPAEPRAVRAGSPAQSWHTPLTPRPEGKLPRSSRRGEVTAARPPNWAGLPEHRCAVLNSAGPSGSVTSALRQPVTYDLWLHPNSRIVVRRWRIGGGRTSKVGDREPSVRIRKTGLGARLGGTKGLVHATPHRRDAGATPFCNWL